MSYRSFTIIPDATDLNETTGVRGDLSAANGIPAITVADGVRLQFNPEQPDFAIEYLTKLAAEATALVQMITEAKS